LLESALAREDERERKGGHGGDGAPFIGDAAGVGDGPRVVPHDGVSWGAWGQRGMAGSGPTVVLTGGVRPAPKHGRAGAN
jgi:hypothetical protein